MGKNLFNSIKLTRPKKNAFDLTHDVKLSCKMGQLVPILVMECVPSDEIILSAECVVKMAPMVAPIMHRVDVTIHYFFCPNRLVWPDWDTWISDYSDATFGAFPYIATDVMDSDDSIKRHFDYMGVPPRPDGSIYNPGVSALPFAAYQMIYNEYYRDQNLVGEVNYTLVNGNNSSNLDLVVTQYRAWEHDYFTAALPFAQKGEAVDIPLGTVTLDPDTTGQAGLWRKYTDHTPATGTGVNITANSGVPQISGTAQVYDPMGTLEVEATTINDLRRAFKLQEWLEKNARGGTRYIENILTHFGVKSSDKRLQRPEYITGVKTPIVISEVLNTTGDTLPQGNMSGHGIGVTSGNYGKYFCEEHGYIIGIMSIMPKTAYQQGIPAHFNKFDQLQYFWPSFANIGEQEVLRQELYAYTANAEQTFGYVPRYAEYKYMPSRVAGDFRTTLDYWHLGRIFATEPSLNQEFIQCIPDTRIFAVETGDYLYCHVLNRIKAIRPMPKYGNPSF